MFNDPLKVCRSEEAHTVPGRRSRWGRVAQWFAITILVYLSALPLMVKIQSLVVCIVKQCNIHYTHFVEDHNSQIIYVLDDTITCNNTGANALFDIDLQRQPIKPGY